MINVAADWNGKPLAALNEFMKKRMRLMGESVKDAVVATAENVLTSLRALTRVAKPQKIRKAKVQVEDTGFYASFSNSERRRVVRTGTSPYAPKVHLDGRIRWLDRGVSRGSRHVYKVTPIRPGEKPYYVAAASPTVAANLERQRAFYRSDRSASLARNAISVAMGMVSTRPPTLGGKPTANKPNLAKVVHTDGGDHYTVDVTDNLAYALAALDGGESAISLAMAKAANKIAGRLAKWQERHFFSGEKVTTPFPEIVRPRKSR